MSSFRDVWSNGPGGAVSVVTTIYSGVSGFSAAASQSYSSANTSLYNNGIPSGSNGYLQNVPSAANVQKSSIYSMDNTYNTYNQDYHQVANGDFNPSAPHAALNAAQVAAAAVATATATATAVALDQSQFQPYHNATQVHIYAVFQPKIEIFLCFLFLVRIQPTVHNNTPHPSALFTISMQRVLECCLLMVSEGRT